MIDGDELERMDAVGVADALAAVRRKVVEAEAEQLCLAAHWADLHAPDFVEESLALLPGSARSRPAGADGCPEIGEFAGAELAALLGRSTGAGEALIADAVNLRHRHPALWRLVRSGAVRVWLAVRVARLCATARLVQEQARWVDAQVAPYVETLTPGRFLDLVAAKIVEVDPEAASARAEASARRRFVHAGRADEQGLRTLVARARAGDVTVLLAVVDRLAAALAEQGSPDPVDVRRAEALRILANPVQALELLLGAAADDAERAPEDLGEAAGWTEEEHAAHRYAAGEGERSDGRWVGRPEESVGWMSDATGRLLPFNAVSGDLEPDDQLPFPVAGDVLLGAQGPSEARPTAEVDAERLRGLVERLARHRDRLSPVCELHVHVTRESLQSGRGVVRVEDVGPTVLAELRTWLTGPAGAWSSGAGAYAGARVRLRPVLQPDGVRPVDCYEVPASMRRAVETLHPVEVFPFGTTPSRRCETDHVTPYARDAGGGPLEPEQTSTGNLAPLAKRHHRIKTHGGWQVLHPDPDRFLWRTPTGHWFEVGPDGTRHLGRGPGPPGVT